MVIEDIVKSLEKEKIVKRVSYFSEMKEFIKDAPKISLGNYLLNMLVAADFKGLPRNKIITYGGDPASGKTYLAQQFCKSLFREEKFDKIIWLETEGSSFEPNEFYQAGFTEDECQKIIAVPVKTVESLRTFMSLFLKQYMEKFDKTNKKQWEKREKVAIILDSIGNITSQKEVNDVEVGKDKEDYTRYKKLKGMFRIITKQLSMEEIPFLLLSHVYDSMDFISQKKFSTGSGAQFGSSHVLLFSRSKMDKGNEQVGDNINIRVIKSRLSRRNKRISLPVRFDTGLNRFTGLTEFFETEADKLFNLGLIFEEKTKKKKTENEELLDEIGSDNDSENGKKTKKKVNLKKYFFKDKDGKDKKCDFNDLETLKEFFFTHFDDLNILFSEDFRLKNTPENY